MSKYSVKTLWNERYGKKDCVYDYAGRLMIKSACGDPNSSYEPTIDHIRPLAQGGKDMKENVVICHWETNAEKGDAFPHWKANGRRFHARKTLGRKNPICYEIIEDERKGNRNDFITLEAIAKHG